MSGQPIAVAVRQGVVATFCIARALAKSGLCAFFLRSYWRLCWFCRYRWRRRLWRWVGLAISGCVLGSLAWPGMAAQPQGGRQSPFDGGYTPPSWAGAGLITSAVRLVAERTARDRIDDASSTQMVRRAVIRFSLLAAISVVVLFAAGLINTWFLASSVPARIGTEYGRLPVDKWRFF